MPRSLLLALAAILSVGCASTGNRTQYRPPIVPAQYVGREAPAPKGLLLLPGDRLAICGDSITEQKMYSRIMEAYLTAARPDLGVTCRQYGWSGEQAGGFHARMQNDVLRFKPTIATTCYGMNDFRYVPRDEAIAETYRQNQTKVVRAFKAAGTRVVLGSSGTIHSVPPWVKSARGTWEELNLALLNFRNIDIEVAEAEGVAFADVYWPMLVKGHESRAKYGDAFKLEGNDGVHPGWAGHVVMATAFLEALGLDGDLGEISVGLDGDMMSVQSRDGQKAYRVSNGAVLPAGEIRLVSERLPFSFEPGDVAKDGTIAAGVELAGFQSKLNRLTLKVSGAKTPWVKVTWGDVSRNFRAAQLESGINLAAEFPANPTAAAFAKVWKAVGEKQSYETRQIKTIFRSPEAKKDMEAVVRSTEVEHARLAEALRASYAPVESVLRIEEVR